jgi:short-subunit dehydrogenase
MRADANVYIIGGSSGIGLAIAKRMAADGASVTIFARRADVLARAAAEIAASGASARVTHRVLDATDGAQVDQVMRATVAAVGAPDVLINCAGRAIPRRFEDVTTAQLEETWHQNVGSCWNTIQTLLPYMKQRGGGYIVNTASLAGLIGVFGYTDYCASKFGLIGFSEALRSELKPHGIMVSVLCPPDTDTPGFTRENTTKPEETRAISARTKVVQPEVVAAALLRGMRRRAFLIVPGFESRFAWLVKRLAPGVVNWVVDRTVRRVRAQH